MANLALLLLLLLPVAAVFGYTSHPLPEIFGFPPNPEHVTDVKPLKADETICIMTRDNICLSTDIFYPSATHSKPWPAVYAKTPYGKSSLGGTARDYTKLGYAFLAQDCRGRHQSNGSYSFWRTSGNDTLDTTAWLLTVPQTYNGLVGTTGVSADALAQYADITGVTQGGGGQNGFDLHNEQMNHFKFGYLIWGDGLGKQTAYQSGAYRDGLITGWLTLIAEPGMVHTVKQNEAFNPWWYPLVGAWDFRPNEAQWSVVNFTAMHSSGWYDIFSNNQLKTAFGVNATAQANGRSKQLLIVDPGGHCGGGAISWPNASYGANVMSSTYGPALFNGAMKAAADDVLFDPQQYIPWNVLFYMLGPGLRGSNGNYWLAAKALPVYTNESFYLAGGASNTDGTLAPAAGTTSGQTAYVYDPTDPVRTHGGNNLILQPCGPQSQASNEHGRADILHFTSAALASDTPIVGMIVAHLFVGSDCVDTDFTAKVIDVFPDGTPMLVQDGIVRMRWREGPYATEVSPAMVGGQVYEIEVEVGYMAYIFNKGHQISLSVSSSNNKRFSVNYNSGNFVIDGNKDWKKANNVVYWGRSHPSRLILPTVKSLDWLEEHRVQM